MTNRLLLLAALAGLGCQGGLKLDEGNAYSCHFPDDYVSPGAGSAAACPKGWVCGVSNRCQPFDPNELLGCEGACPQVSAEATKLHPAFDEPVEAVGSSGTFGWDVAAYTANGTLLTIGPSGFNAFPVLPGLPVRELVPLQGARLLRVLGQPDVARASLVGLSGTPREVKRADDSTVVGLIGARAAISSDQLWALGSDGAPLELTDQPLQTRVLATPRTAKTGGGTLQAIDLQAIEGTALPVGMMAASSEGLWWLEPGRTWTKVSNLGPANAAAIGSLSSSSMGTLWTLAYSGQPLADAGKNGHATLDHLALYRLTGVDAISGRPTLTRAFDCQPCAGGTILAAMPGASDALTAEVLCQQSILLPDLSTTNALSAWRISGESVTMLGSCEAQPLPDPFELSELSPAQAFNPNFGGVVNNAFALDLAKAGSIAAGGRHGQLWTGSALSAMRPVTLDRVPELVLPFADGFALVAGNQLAFFTAPNAAKPIVLSSSGQTSLEAFVPLDDGGVVWIQSDGWVMRTNGPTPLALRRLLDSRGNPARGPFQLARTSGGDFVATADDGVYFFPGTPVFSTAERALAPEQVPQLTPDPNFPIQSLVLDGSAEALEASLARGYLSTRRGVYLFEFAKDGRVSRTPLVEGVGEPVEVWTDSPTSKVGRVGLRDGRVLSLPGALPVVGTLPSSGNPAADVVVDFAALGPLPVALTQGGKVFLAAKSESAIPGWNELPLTGVPNAAELFAKGKLAVRTVKVSASATRYELFAFGKYGYVYRVASLTL